MHSINKGYLMALAVSLISGFSVFINKFAVEFWKDSAVFTAVKNIFVALALSLLAYLFQSEKIKNLSRIDWLRLVFIGLIGGSIPFLLFFYGLTLTTAVNAAFIHKTMFLWVALASFVFLRKGFQLIQLLAMGILSASVVFLGFPNQVSFGYGELFVLMATLMWAAEAIIVQKLFTTISPLVAAWGRLFFGSLFLLGYLASQGIVSEVIPSTSGEWLWALITAGFLLAYITTFYSAIKMTSAALASSVLVLAAPVTMVLNNLFSAGKLPDGFFSALPLALIGIFLLLYFSSRSSLAEQSARADL